MAYARSDSERARSLANELKERGLKAWFDDQILPGTQWQDAIRDAISTSTVFLVLISESFPKSGALTLELGAMLSARRIKQQSIIIPVIIPPTQPEDLPAGLAEFQTIQLNSSNEGEVANKIIAALENTPERTELAIQKKSKFEWHRTFPKTAPTQSGLEKNIRRISIISLAVLSALFAASLLLWLGYDEQRQRLNQLESQNELLVFKGGQDSRISADLSGAELPQVDFSGVNLSHANLSGANLEKAILDKANMRTSRLIRANLISASLREANFEGSDFNSATLQAADFSRSDLRNADFTNANLTKALLSATNLDNAEFKRAILNGADLSAAKGLTSEQLDVACGDSETKLPSGLSIPQCEMVRPNEG